MKARLGILSALLPVWIGCDGRSAPTAPTPPEPGNRIGLVLRADGRPAAGAKVRVHAVDFLPEAEAAGVEPYALIADGFGRFDAATIPDGAYNISAQLDSGYGLRDSVILDGSQAPLPALLLSDPGSWEGRLSMQPGYDPRRVAIRLYGSERIAYPDADGRFGFRNLAAGRYRARLDPAEAPEKALVLALRVEPGSATVSGRLPPPFSTPEPEP